MHKVAQIALQIVTQPCKHTKINTGDFVIAVFLQLCPLHPCTKNDHIFTDVVFQPIFFYGQDDTSEIFIFSAQKTTPYKKLYKNTVEIDRCNILQYNYLLCR